MLLLFSIITNSIVEILGLAVIVPVIGLVVQPEQIQTNTYLKRAFDLTGTFGIDTPKNFLILLCALMFGAFLFKALFGLAVNLFQTRFSFSVAHRLSGQMWTYHFSQSLERMRSANSGQILAQINGWPLSFANAFMVGGLMILNEITVIALIASGLLAYNPIVFLSVAVLLALGAFIIRTATKRRLEAYSAIRQQLEPHTNTLITNATRGFLEVITFRAVDAVRDAYLKDRSTIFRISSNTTVLNLTPAKLYEVLAVLAIAGSIIIALLQGTPGRFPRAPHLMAISAYRIMPSMSRLNGAVMQMKGQKYALDTMELGASLAATNTTPQSIEANSTDDKISITLESTTLKYESLDEPVIENLTHRFEAGKLHGIIGPSGSGKSTVISSLLALHSPESGQIQISFGNHSPRILGQDLRIHEWILNVGYLSQQPFLFEGSVRDNLTLRVPGATINEQQVDFLLKELKLQDCLGENPLDFVLQEGGSNLSGGQQQRLALLRALQAQRPVLILDEATSALDSELRDIVFNLLRKRAEEHCNVLLVTHDLKLAQRCDDILDLGSSNDSISEK